MIDFGVSTMYKDIKGNHIPFADGKGLVGTANYASLGTHCGYQQSRRDDMEVIGNTIITMMKGCLPWTKFVGSQTFSQIVSNTPLKKLCENCPNEIFQYMTYCRNLDFTEEPDYEYLISLL